MKISTKGRYGLRILVDIASHVDDSPRLMRDICTSQNISEKYASRLVISLRKAGLISAVRGAHGGFKLRKKPSEITLLEVIEAMEGAISVVECVVCPKSCKRSPKCLTRGVWCKLNQAVRDSLSSTTLADILDDSEFSGSCDYCI